LVSDEATVDTIGASFPIPLAGAVALALPLSPYHFMTLLPREIPEPEAALRSVMDTPSMLSALSIGVGSAVRKVVLPPEMAPANDDDRSKLREVMFTLRSSARRVVELFGEANAVVGLPSWRRAEFTRAASS